MEIHAGDTVGQLLFSKRFSGRERKRKRKRDRDRDREREKERERERKRDRQRQTDRQTEEGIGSFKMICYRFFFFGGANNLQKEKKVSH